jgi:predicted phosphodiesterase
MRIFAVSDVHIDYQENRQWLAELSFEDYREDVLILAGDLTDSLPLLQECFAGLVKKFLKVLFVPGNHELWVPRNKTMTSVEKFQQVCKLAKDSGLSLEPFQVKSLSIVPLLSWYDFSFASPSAKLMESWVDFQACFWPDHLTPSDVTAYFLEKNEAYLHTTNDKVISFSHFLPRIDLMSAQIPQAYHYLYPVLGSVLLERQIRVLKPDIHVFGHSHVNRSVTLDGIQYINNAFGYPSEHRIARKSLVCIYEC